MSITIRSSTLGALADPARPWGLEPGQAVELTDLDGAILARREDILALADELAEEELLDEMVSYRTDVTGVDNAIFISPRGMTRHAPRIKLAINLPDALNPQSETAAVAIADGAVVAGQVPPHLLEQARRFIDANRDVLVDYWEYRIDTEQLRKRLKSV
jgi:hypothetical protein